MESDSDPSTTDLLDPKNEEGWEDVEPDVEDQTFKSLFEDKWFGDITQMFKYDKEKHGFEFVKLKNQLSSCNNVQSSRDEPDVDHSGRTGLPGPRSVD